MTYSGMKNQNKINQLIGGHFSAAGGLENALKTAGKLNCNVVQLFSKNARTWKETMPDKASIRKFIKERKNSGIKKLLTHASYLINIVGNDKWTRLTCSGSWDYIANRSSNN